MTSIFPFLKFDFMVLALIAVLIISPLFGTLGTLIVTRKMAFFSDALGHSALTGIAIGVIFGISNTNISMIIFALVFAFILNEISRRTMASKDTIISVFSSASLAIGLAILSRGGNFSKYSALLVGDILSINKTEIIYLLILFVIVMAVYIIFGNKLLAISLNPQLSRSRGIRVGMLENLFSMIVALVVTLSIKWVGILIINALLILPAAAASNISDDIREYHLLAVIFSVFSGVAGLIVSYYTNVATGPMIVIIAAVIYFGTYIYMKNNPS